MCLIMMVITEQCAFSKFKHAFPIGMVVTEFSRNFIFVKLVLCITLLTI